MPHVPAFIVWVENGVVRNNPQAEKPATATDFQTPVSAQRAGWIALLPFPAPPRHPRLVFRAPSPAAAMYGAMHPPPVPPHPYDSYGVGVYEGGRGEPGRPPPARGGVGGGGVGGGGDGRPPPWGGGIPPPPTRFDDMAAMPVSELEVGRRGGGVGGERGRLEGSGFWRGGWGEEHPVGERRWSLVDFPWWGGGGSPPHPWWPWVAPGCPWRTTAAVVAPAVRLRAGGGGGEWRLVGRCAPRTGSGRRVPQPTAVLSLTRSCGRVWTAAAYFFFATAPDALERGGHVPSLRRIAAVCAVRGERGWCRPSAG